MTTRDLLLEAWTWRPGVVLALTALLTLHLALYRLSRPARTAAAFAAAAAIFLALASPIDVLARGTLFSAHMLQHLLLALFAPPLALLSVPTVFRSTPPRGVPAVVPWMAGVGAMWIWHAAALCNAAATSDAVRAIQNTSLPFLGALFWWPILGPRLDQRLPEARAAAYLITACFACTVLGVSIAFSPVDVCAAYRHPVDRLGLLPLVQGSWGLSPAVDQQLGGLLMWVPGCTAYAAAVLAIVARFYGAASVKDRGVAS